MNHQRCLQAKVKYRNEPKQVMPKSEDPSRSLEINAILTFDTEFPTIFNKSCTYITFKSAVKHRQLGYAYPWGQTVHLAEAMNVVYITYCLNKFLSSRYRVNEHQVALMLATDIH